MERMIINKIYTRGCIMYNLKHYLCQDEKTWPTSRRGGTPSQFGKATLLSLAILDYILPRGASQF